MTRRSPPPRGHAQDPLVGARKLVERLPHINDAENWERAVEKALFLIIEAIERRPEAQDP